VIGGPVLVLLTIAGFAVIAALQHRRAPASVFSLAFTATAIGTVLIVSGLTGCQLHKDNWSFVGCAPWSASILWNEVAVGAGVLLLAVMVWRRALQSIDN
jgi:hypothetical protein